MSGAKQGTVHTAPPKEWADNMSQPSGLTHGSTLIFTQLRHLLTPSGSKQRNLLLVFTPSYSTHPSKALPEFLIWPHQFLLIKESKNLAQQQFYLLFCQHLSQLSNTPTQHLLFFMVYVTLGVCRHTASGCLNLAVNMTQEWPSLPQCLLPVEHMI